MANSVTTSTCPYCLQTKPSSTPATPPLSEDVREDVLDAEIKCVEKLISNLFLERSRLYRKRNEMRSPIYSLPQEILILIFTFACPLLNFTRAYGLQTYGRPVPHPRIIGVLAMVSAHWHNVVLSTPSLWASFVADDQDMNAMQTVFTRSGSLSVVASLNFPYESALREHHTALLAPVLQKHASRVRMLHVRNALPTWLNEHIPRFVDLEVLSLHAIRGDRDEVVVIDRPCGALVLKGFSCRISLSWSQLDILHLSSIPAYDCFVLLKNCPRLRKYRLRNTSDYSVEEGELPCSPFILPCLELFEWMVDDEDPVGRAVLKYIRMPALQSLVWNESFANLKPSDFLSSFFEHLPSTLSEVQLQNTRIHSNFSIFSYISNLSSVECLILKRCTGSFMDRVFSNLGSETCLVENQTMPVLPKLKSVCVDGLPGYLDQAKVLQTLQRGCSQPLESQQGNPFRLEFAKRYVAWKPEVKEELIRMVEKGYKVELWEDSKPVDWLSRVKLPQT